MNQLLVAPRTRPDIDLPTFLGKYEFTVVPSSLFAPDGPFYKETEKAYLTKELRNLQIQPDKFDAEMGGVLETNFKKAIIVVVDGMAFINKVNIKTFQLRTSLDFTECSISVITNESRRYNEVRIVFDRYNPKSLKSNTRAAHAKEISSLRYKICHTTKIEHMETKDFTSPIEKLKVISKNIFAKNRQWILLWYMGAQP